MPAQDPNSSLEIPVANAQLSVAFVTGWAPKNKGGGVFVFKFWGLRGSQGVLGVFGVFVFKTPELPGDVVTVGSQINVLGKGRTVKRAKVFASTVAFLFVGGLVVFIKNFLIMAFDYVSHVCSAAVADLQVVSIKYFVELV